MLLHLNVFLTTLRFYLKGPLTVRDPQLSSARDPASWEARVRLHERAGRIGSFSCFKERCVVYIKGPRAARDPQLSSARDPASWEARVQLHERAGRIGSFEFPSGVS